ncbi:hypothetical protein K458DRAFT_445246 [Lentithecium fluviatile CBS 122367]|uniref:Transcription regulator Rua1 C-terminal domain-containing protein n=1 Tax=Lentithecium fluviatile CBS 122367 TaxID=1168545 RepID=A0A6G1IQ39_9PLEO|nr:hypothetical protein K458DRAFT_445246 [Lentithecium fluviatile CBS 122367]
MEFNAVQQYRPSPNRSYTVNQPAGHQTQMMYPYGISPPQHQQHQQPQQHQQRQQHQAHPMHQVSRPSPPQPTWAVPQTHNPYYHMQKGPMAASRDDPQQLIARSDVTTSHSPAMSTATFRQDMGGPQTLGTTDYFPGVIDTSPWGQKVCEELESFPSMDPDMNEFNQGLMSHDENTPIIDLRQYHSMEQHEADNMATFNPNSTRRMSESSFSISSTGGVLPEVSNYEEMGSSEAVSYASDCDAWNSLEPAPSLLSPLASPRRPQHDNVVRSGSRSRASPAPHNNVRSSPYTMESSRFKRWSTGHAPTSTPTTTRALAQVQDRFAPYGPRLNPHHSMPAYPPNAMANFGMHTQNVLYSSPHPLQSSNPTMFASPDHPFQLEVPRPLPSQGLFRLLQSNADRHGGCASHFADLSDPPDLYSSLHEEACDPPESDMNPSDPDLVPHEQDLRFAGDLYTPRWVRGHGNKREGWCGLCKPGRWLVLKNSAFWYDKSFTHGVSAATGAAFQGPQDTRRTEGNLDVWEGLCGSCGEWIALVSSKKKGTTWFRHAYKCHTHPKVKDGPKRRRETHAVRTRAVSSASASSSYPIKSEVQNQDSKPNRHSTPIPTSSLVALGIPTSTPTMPTSTQSTSAPYLTTSAYPTPTPSIATSHTPASAPEFQPKREPVVGLFTSPLQPGSTFNPAHQVSEPELVGVPRTTALSSLASMI